MELEPAPTPGLPVAVKVGGGILVAIVAFLVIQSVIGFLFKVAVFVAVVAAIGYAVTRMAGNSSS